MRVPRAAVACPNCGVSLLGARCDVCGYLRHRPAIYPLGHDALTDSYMASEPLGGGARRVPTAASSARALPPSGSATGRSVPLVAPGR